MALVFPDSAAVDAALTALALSFRVASVATLLALIAGTGVAYLLARIRFFGRNVAESILTLPLVLPPTVLGYYLLVLLGRNGWIGHLLDHSLGIQLIFTWQGAAIAAALVSFPLVLKSARTAFESVDADLENAARTLGLSGLAVFWRITLPLAWRGILAGTLLAFARAMGEFGATLMVAGSIPGKTQTLSLAVYEAVQAGHDDLASMLVLMISVSCITILLLAGRLAGGNRWSP